MIKNKYILKLGSMYLGGYNIDSFNSTHYVEFYLEQDKALEMNYDEKEMIKKLVETMLDIQLESEMI